MATYQLGPEKPRPFSVLSENHIRQQVDLPCLPEHERYSFGQRYEEKMCEHIHKYLEVDTDSSLCYVGEPKGSLVPLLQSKFCLLKPVTTVIPGHIHYEESPNHHMLPIKVASVGAEDFFRREALADSPQTFDKILLKDAIQCMDDPKTTFKNIQKCLNPGGKVLIINRSAPMNTLPVFTDAKLRLEQYDQSYEVFIQELQKCGLDVTWDIECLPIIMSKDKWYGMLHERFPSQMELVSDYEVRLGLRELSEGVFKYGDHPVEFSDRLLFITASVAKVQQLPRIQRHKFALTTTAPQPPKPTTSAVKLMMEVTPELQSFVREKERTDASNKRHINNCSLFN